MGEFCSSSLLHFKPIYTAVRCRSNFARSVANQLLRVVRMHFTMLWGPFTAKYLVKKCRIAYKKPTGTHEHTSDNIALARKFEKHTLEQITEEEKKAYEKYEDVRMEGLQCNAPGYNDNAAAIAQLWAELDRSTRQIGNPRLSEELWQKLCVHRYDRARITRSKFLKLFETQPRTGALLSWTVTRREEHLCRMPATHGDCGQTSVPQNKCFANDQTSRCRSWWNTDTDLPWTTCRSGYGGRRGRAILLRAPTLPTRASALVKRRKRGRANPTTATCAKSCRPLPTLPGHGCPRWPDVFDYCTKRRSSSLPDPSFYGTRAEFQKSSKQRRATYRNT